MLFAIIKNGVVIGIESHDKNPNFYGFTVVPVDETIKIGMTYDKENNTFANEEIESVKQRFISTVQNKAQWAFDLLDVKYAWTHQRGISTKIAEEWKSWKVDNSVATPIIDIYANQKSRTRDEQLQKIERIIMFEVASTIKIELLIGRIQDATEENIEAIATEIDTIDTIDTVDGFMQMIVGQ